MPNRSGTTVDVDVRGTTAARLVHVRDVLWYRVNKTDLVRLVIVRDPDGVEPDDYFFTTDLTASGGQVAFRYADRWAIEVCFRDVKQDLGGQNPQSWKRRGPERAAALSLWLWLWLHATTWCWYLTTHPTGRTWTPRPWYRTKTKPSFLDTLAALRCELWSRRTTATSRSRPDDTKIVDTILDTLAYAAQPNRRVRKSTVTFPSLSRHSRWPVATPAPGSAAGGSAIGPPPVPQPRPWRRRPG